MVNESLRKGIPIEAITGPRGVLELEEWRKEVAFLDEHNELALGSGEKGAITDAEIQDLFSPWFVKATPFSFYLWELIGIPFSYIFGEKRPKYIGLERAEMFINKVYETTGLKGNPPLRDVREFTRLMKDLYVEEGEGKEEDYNQYLQRLAIEDELLRKAGYRPLYQITEDGRIIRVRIEEVEEEERTREEAGRARYGYEGVPCYFGYLPTAEEIKEVIEYLDKVAQERGEEYAEKLKDRAIELYKAYFPLVYAKSGEAFAKAMRRYAEGFEAIYESYCRGG